MRIKNIYTLHRRLSLIIAIPLVLSAASGLMHPIMTNIRPAVATQGLSPVAIDSSQLLLSPEAALDSNHVTAISKIRIVHVESNWFYQVQREEMDVPVYISTRTGKMLPHGDYLYAQYLARQFLEGQSRKTGLSGHPDGTAGGMTSMKMDPSPALPDCCSSATEAVLYARGSRVVAETRLDSFDEEYAEVNRLLPVYKVAFSRPDGIRVYVETSQDRFALAVDDRRAAFNKVFRYIHTYQWLDFLGKGRPVAEFLLFGLAFLTTLLGIYIFFATKSKRVAGNPGVKARRNHRYTAIVVSLFTLMFTFSGAWHALVRLQPDTRNAYFVRNRFAADSIRFDYAAIRRAVGGRSISGISLEKMEGQSFWRVVLMPKIEPVVGAHTGKAKDLMKDMKVGAPELTYLRLSDYSVQPNGDEIYARYLATLFSGHPDSMISQTTLVTKFDRDYNFTDKRLPVWKISYPVHHQERYYIETSSGRLSVRVDDQTVMEGYSFAFFHKHEFLAGLGKPVKDFSTIFWAAAQLFMVAFGLLLFFRMRKRKYDRTPNVSKSYSREG